MKILTLILPTYNAQKFLDKGLTSMILPAEWMEKLEVIVVNDGSSDNSAEVAQQYVDRYPGTFCILNKQNGGHGSGINAGVKAARGRYFKVIDADDWVDTDALMQTMQILEQEPPVDALIQSYRTHDISTSPATVKTIAVAPPSQEQTVYSLEELMDGPYCTNCMTFHGLTYRTDFYRNQHYDMPEHVFYEDQEYSTIPLCRAQTLRVLDLPLYEYRIGDVNQSVSSASMLKRLDHFLTVERRMLAFEPNLIDCPDGAYAFWEHKMSKFLTDIYRVMLIRSKDKRIYRNAAENLTQEVRVISESLYQRILPKYEIFKKLNRLHVSDRMFTFMLRLRRRKSN